jgi:hypothetical protein
MHEGMQTTIWAQEQNIMFLGTKFECQNIKFSKMKEIYYMTWGSI